MHVKKSSSSFREGETVATLGGLKDAPVPLEEIEKDLTKCSDAAREKVKKTTTFRLIEDHSRLFSINLHRSIALTCLRFFSLLLELRKEIM